MSGVRRRAVRAALAVAVGLGVVVSTGAAAAAAEPVLQPGETASSGNIHLLTNVPKSGAFASSGAYNSDLAFKDDYAFAGNYNGFTVYDIKNPRKSREVKQVVCPGSQNDISVHGNLLVLSVDSRRTAYDPSTQAPVADGDHDSCDTRSLSTSNSNPHREADRAALAAGDYWEGIRLFDVSDPANPRYVSSVETDCGSHTHTLVPAGDTLFVYVSSYDVNSGYAKCQPPHDKISVVSVPVADATAASVVAEPVLFEDGGLNPGTRGCHDITAYPSKGIAAGACMGEGVIMDISEPAAPTLVERVQDTANFAFWHSATFNDDATSVIFTDELGGGAGATCNPTVGPNKGANAIYTLDADRQLTFASYYKIPREQASTENCVAHNGSLIPAKGKDVMVQSWYQGGISFFDFTDPANPVELGWFDRGPLQPADLGGTWSTYYYEGYVYSNDIQKGFDVFEIRDPRVANGKSGTFPSDYNPQSQSQPSFG